MRTKLQEYFPMIKTRQTILNEIDGNPKLCNIFGSWDIVFQTREARVIRLIYFYGSINVCGKKKGKISRIKMLKMYIRLCCLKKVRKGIMSFLMKFIFII